MARKNASRSLPIDKGDSNGQRPTTLASRFGGPASGDRIRINVGWVDANPLELLDAVRGCVDSGDAILFGRTSDGGALVITILSGDERRKFYPDDADSVGAALRLIAGAYAGVGSRQEIALIPQKK
jgi:hypothetical protein